MKRFVIVLMVFTTFIVCAAGKWYYSLVDSAEFYIGGHEWEKAEYFIQQALRVEPDNQNTSLLLSNLATVQRYQGKWQDALKNYTIALFMTPNAVTLLKNRASLYLDMDSIDKAYSDYSKVLELDGNDIEALYNRGILALEKKQMEKSEADFQKIKDISPNSYFAYNGFAMWNKANGNYSKAIENYGIINIRNALETDPHNGFLYLLRAKLNRLRCENDAARRDVEIAMEHGVDESVAKSFLEKD